MTASEAPFVAISVVNWNTAEITLQCLQSLHALRYSNFRIVLIDNASSDDSVRRIRRDYPNLTVIQNRSNTGFAAGHESGYREAQTWGASAVWLVNSDVQVDSLALIWLVDAWQRHGDAIYGSAPLVHDGKASVLMNFPGKYLIESGIPRVFQRDSEIPFDETWRERSPLRVGAVSGSCFFLPLQVARIHGWLDPSWFLYCEEIDYCYRLRQRGVSCYLVPKSQVWHRGGESHRHWSSVSDCIQYYRARNEIVLAQRHSGRLTGWSTAIKKVARSILLLPTNPRRGRFVFLGVRDALRGRMGKTFRPEDYIDGDRS